MPSDGMKQLQHVDYKTENNSWKGTSVSAREREREREKERERERVKQQKNKERDLSHSTEPCYLSSSCLAGVIVCLMDK